MSVVSRRLAWFAALALAVPLLATSGAVATPAAAATTFVVDTVVDLLSLDECTAAPGDCSLRGAISAANATPGADTIHFNLPSGDCPGGVCRITLAAGGFSITEAVDLDATTQPQHGSPHANVCATVSQPSHLRVEIVVDAGMSRSPFSIGSSTGTTQVRGFALGTNMGGGVGVLVHGGDDHHIACNHFSLNAAGTGALGSGNFAADLLTSYDVDGIVIGTDGDGVGDIGERNVFGSSAPDAIVIDSTINNTIAGNYFGFTADGTTRLGAGPVTLRDNTEGTVVGTNEDGVSDDLERNYFTGNETNLRVDSGPFDADNVRIVGNTFGFSPTGVFANNNLGIEVSGVPPSTTGFEIRGNSFGYSETGMELDANGTVLISGNTFGGDDNGTPYGSLVAIRPGHAGSYLISNNLILNSQLAGILVEDAAVLAAGSRDNCLMGNGIGVSNTTGAEIVFEDNWWGDVTGPSVAGPGTGDPVGYGVDFDPWLTSPPAQCNTAPVAADANFTVAEDAATGTVLGTIAASDDGTDLSYAITAGNLGGGFALDSVTGQLTVAKSLDYETIPAYVLTVQVSDPFLSDTASVAVLVTDVDEPTPEPTFRDVPATHTFYDDVEWLAATGITRGCNPPVNDLYCPDGSVTRGQMAAFLHRALGDTLVPGVPVEFVDDDGSVFETDIEWLGSVGVTRGCNPPVNDRFCPDEAVTRGQMAAFLVRALNLPAGTGIDFVDDDGSIFEADIERFAAAEITRGCNPPTNDMFCPDDPVSRAQMAAFLHRALG